MDERVKHRLIGAGVLVFVALLVVIMIVNHSHQKNRDRQYVVTRLPRPHLEHHSTQPVLVVKAVELALIKTPVAPSVPEKKVLSPTVVAPHPPVYKPKTSIVAAKKEIKKKHKPVAAVFTPTKISLTAQKKRYSVQLATLSTQKNASSLVKKLKTAGYNAYVRKTKMDKKPVYKVIVGRNLLINEAKRLQKTLAKSTKINGFILSTKVG